MYSLVEAVQETCFKKPEVNVLMLGLDGAGKTYLFERAKATFSQAARASKRAIPFGKIGPTLGMNIAKLDVGGCRVMLWDLGGELKMRDIWPRYYAEAHGVIFVVDATDPARFDEARTALFRAFDHSDLDEVPCVVVANKRDLANAEPATVIENIMRRRDDARPTLVASVSALANVGVDDAIAWLVHHAKAFVPRHDVVSAGGPT